MRRMEWPKQPAIGVRTVGAKPEQTRLALWRGGDLGVVGQMRDFAGGEDRALPVDAHPVACPVGHSGTDNEVEGRGAPHAVRNSHLWQAREIEARRTNMRGALLALHGQLDGKLHLR